MPRVCQLSGKKTITGYKVSHSNRHTKRTWKVNLRKIKVGDKVIKVSAKYLKKYGLALKLGTLKIK
ncbi:MAG: 50S ribosomal protein L28 [Candidatus Calescibacterium sp.]|nr:50S ribosomal protein L28 [Candidatus Calescibacterium sp.]MCX7971853.1 50S ribosomal protein L28 [bacterium]MDW8195048.1 50S ribosomal protein L28 [Candidatus Calescibacterium sp.]